MLQSLAQILIGFSVIASIILMVAYVFFLKSMRKTTTSMISCAVLLGALIGLQCYHWLFFENQLALFEHRAYVLLLIATPASFFFFSRAILFPDSRPTLSDLAHLVPFVIGIFLPARLAVAVGVTVGCLYALWFVAVVVGMRRNIRRFRFEAFFFVVFAVLAMVVLALGVATPLIDPAIFYLSYSTAIGVALGLVVASLIGFPEILDDINAVAQLTYANTTLADIDVDTTLAKLEALMRDEKVFQNENLNLKLLAQALDISAHQLSEMVNTRCGMGFSRYIREQRVAEAKRLLRDRPKDSILSISLATGFKSQSNFYTAFREVTGQSPGEYRDSL